MNPLDARFVMHSHLEESHDIGFVEGGLRKMDLVSQWQQIKEETRKVLQSNGLHGFVTIESIIDPSGKTQSFIKHSQLIPVRHGGQNSDSSLEQILQIVSKIAWPRSNTASKLVYALCSELQS